VKKSATKSKKKNQYSPVTKMIPGFNELDEIEEEGMANQQEYEHDNNYTERVYHQKHKKPKVTPAHPEIFQSNNTNSRPPIPKTIPTAPQGGSHNNYKQPYGSEN
jgi:hypothetical protein